MALPTTYDRVPAHTSESINQRIERMTFERVRHSATNPALISQRLKELEAEWDIERAIEANAAVLAFIGVALASCIILIGWYCRRS